jgi:hypothetical protein
MKVFCGALAGVAFATLLSVTSASATIVISAGQSPGNPDENVLFNVGGQTGTTVNGFTNNTNTAVSYTSTQTLSAAGGQADITSANGITNLSWQLALGSGWTEEQFFLLTNSVGSTVTFTYTDQFNQTFTLNSSPLSTNGTNPFFVTTSGGEIVTSASLSITGGSLTHFEQDRLTVATVAPPVPEASTWAMMILGFMGIGFMAYRRKSQGAQLRLV